MYPSKSAADGSQEKRSHQEEYDDEKQRYKDQAISVRLEF